LLSAVHVLRPVRTIRCASHILQFYLCTIIHHNANAHATTNHAPLRAHLLFRFDFEILYLTELNDRRLSVITPAKSCLICVEIYEFIRCCNKNFLVNRSTPRGEWPEDCVLVKRGIKVSVPYFAICLYEHKKYTLDEGCS
jgi:hypothetical protein